METTNTPPKHGLLSELARHEVGPSDVLSGESSQGLRPRLPNRFEALDAKVETLPFEEQQSETSISSPKFGFTEEPSEAVGLRAVKSSFPQENLLQPDDRFQYRVPSLEPARALRQPNELTPEAGPQFRRIKSSEYDTKFSAGAAGSTPPAANSLLPSRAVELPKEQSITEKLTTVERETIREIHSLKTSISQSGRLSGLVPQMQPVQVLASPAMEKASPPNIEIHIGRIEVRAHIQAPQPKPEKMSAPATNDGALQAYLRGRSRGARS